MVLASTVTNFFTSRLFRAFTITGAACLATACVSGGGYLTNSGDSWGAPKYGTQTSASRSTNTDWQAVARRNQRGAVSSGGHQKIGRPYTVRGKTYIPARDDNYNRVGTASWYGPNFHGKKTANGETFNQNAMTAAHPTLPLPSVVKVTNLSTGKQILVRVNDRGPFVDNRMIDLSKRAATELGYKSKGTTKVRVEYVGPAPLKSSRKPIALASATSKVKVRPTPKPVASNVWPDDPREKYSIALSRPRTSVSGWFVQAGAYSNRQRAEQVADAMQIDQRPSVQTAYVANRYIYRVLVGPFANKPEAVAQREKVVAAGFAKARVTEQN
ncbi:Septum-associated rare lipoprotein A [hydrothermal vent metagenome]|uniref:Septum-associated rare lipoprotein A n=1 Tax=hydrothermal vent metagenome TaxID=652676 RepID=A0A3B0RAE3_9ZZZZ